MEFVLIGLISAFNLLVVLVKVKKGRFEDAIFDAALMFLLSSMFSGSYGGMVVAMVASLSVSIWLFISPPTFSRKFVTFFKSQIDEFNKDFGTPPSKKNTTKTSKDFEL